MDDLQWHVVRSLPSAMPQTEEFVARGSGDPEYVRLVRGVAIHARLFENARRALERLDGHGFARVVASSNDAARPWIALTIADGTPLLDAAARPQHDEGIAVGWLTEIADKVLIAASRGVTGLLLTPDSIRVTTDGGVELGDVLSLDPIPLGSLPATQLAAVSAPAWADLAQTLADLHPAIARELGRAANLARQGDLAGAVRELPTHTESVTAVGWSAASAARTKGHNQDAWLADGTRFVVADGVGGCTDGAAAAREAIREISGRRANLTESFRSAHHRLRRAAIRYGQGAELLTTLCGIAEHDGGVELASTGDSRAYLLRDGHARQLTTDQNLSEFGAGARLLTSCAGGSSEPRTHSRRLGVKSGDRIVICSDGAYRHWSFDVLERSALFELDACAHLLVADAVANGANDDVTVVVAEFGSRLG